MTCFMTAQGRLLADTSPLVAVETPGTGQGVRLTLDADLQRACEGLATLYLPRGCLVVMDTATGEELASVSMPSFDPQNVAASIATPTIPRCSTGLSAHSVPGRCSRSCWLQPPTRAALTGTPTTARVRSRLPGRPTAAHWTAPTVVVNLRGALEQSCNTYFIELGRLLGAQRIRKWQRHSASARPRSLRPACKAHRHTARCRRA
ncbi:MAG: hypothetical protein ACLT3F_07555 [Gemmiger formicilis]|uniref:hypothetical protein n=1 Tax=Gemmiger formicilis TaxID=745368 RepID=UPI0039968D33